MTNEHLAVKVHDSHIIDGGVVIFIPGVGMLSPSKNEAWKLYLAMQSYFAALPRNKRKGKTCPDCVPPKIIDDRAKKCRNHRVRKGKGDETANTE